MTAPTSSPSPLHDRIFVAGRPHPRVTMHGPQVGRVASVPLVEDIGPLPFHEGQKPRRPLILAALLLALLAAGAVAFLVLRSNDSPAGEQAGRAAGRSAKQLGASATTAPSVTSGPSPVQTTSHPPATSKPAPPTTIPQAVAKAKLPLHGATYRGGKLYLAGALPSRKIADAFVRKASAVIGRSNVIEHYVIDKRAPVPTDGRVRVDEPFLFATNSAEINPGYEPLLTLGVTVMQLNPQVTMKVVGYTDDTGPLGINQALSKARAQAVADWITARGVSADRFAVIGKGPADPVASNATPQGRTRNRRIEVVLLGLLKS